jgi:hypothetical protein
MIRWTDREEFRAIVNGIRFIATFLLVAAMGIAPALGAARTDVLAADAALNHAVPAHDTRTTGNYITGDYTLTLGSGKFMTRRKFLAFVADRSVTLTVNRGHDELVRFYGTSTAIVTGIVEEAGHAGANPFDIQVPFTDTWVLQGGRWRQAAGHGSSPLKKAS